MNITEKDARRFINKYAAAEVGTYEVPGEGTFEDYYNQYMQQPDLKRARVANRLFLHAFPVWAGGILGTMGGAANLTAHTARGDYDLDKNFNNTAFKAIGKGTAIGSAAGLIASALLYPVIKGSADKMGREEAWRYAAMRSGRLNPEKTLV